MTNHEGSQCPLRRQTKREILLHLDKSQLITQISFRGNHCNEILHSARDANALIRNNYKDFIHQVGRNVFPLIIASDHENDGYSGVGSTLTLYRSDGSVETYSPQTYYELYKTCSHLFMAIAVEIGPYMSNDCVCTSTTTVAACDGDDESSDAQLNHSNAKSSTSSSVMESSQKDIPQPWESSMSNLVRKAQILHQSILNATAIESNKKCTHNNKEDEEKDSHSNNNCTLPPPAMLETVLSMLTSIIHFCHTCLTTKQLNLPLWTKLNQENFPRIKRCMQEATSLQANSTIRQIQHWKDTVLSPQEWRELYVVIPTVWAVDRNNPRKEIFQRLMHPDRVETHLITSEWPRDHGEVRTLLGRIVGDRAIGRLVFGDATEEQRVKTMGLSSGVDVVMDDALPAICRVLKELGVDDDNDAKER
mmetsp:Transcript_838/g.1278  ORF Transcript_838/g.1278 Transcript_838/m.1278 type:complete len:420 (-) Transcript_838:25-1284(-)